MKTVTDVLNWYNKRDSGHYHKIKVKYEIKGLITQYEDFFDVYDISYRGDLLCFYGRNEQKGTMRYIRINEADIIRSEV